MDERARWRKLGAAIGAVCSALLAATTLAAIADDGSADSLLRDKRYNEARRLAERRLASDPTDEQAYWLLARAGLETIKETADLERLADTLQPCLERIPQSALCHLALGETYGAIAASGGMLKGMKYAGRVREELEKAVELDPRNFTARDDLNQFYLMAPGIVGGGADKAERNTAAFEAVRPEAAPLLRAGIHLQNGQLDRAGALLLAPEAFASADLADGYRSALTSLGFRQLEAKQTAKALETFRRGRERFPNDASLCLGYGRSELETGQVDAAITSLRRAVELDPQRGAQYRLGIALQTKGDEDAAATAFREYIALPTAKRSGDTLKDAKRRLQQLKPTS
ncbi:tetratricopeptide repeat protein [Dokdonella sp.]|uniref:tetratricopeptide repeat protein n=1 Tax=Dokdonella sp. TaxID=2291710 RepID=UPI001B2A07B5|nr:tetratricopeptide repeat protein [Dokdonella sp.]MBO9662137.1 tetratricopeptide repeat protein [Dokdonella sp.]